MAAYGIFVSTVAMLSAKEGATVPRLQPTNTPKPLTTQQREHYPGGCSWYCGAPAIHVSATSALTEKNGYTHPAEHAHDHDLNTAWCSAGDSAGEKLTFEFVTSKQDVAHLAVTSCAIYSGYQATEKLFRQNARPKTLQLFIDGHPAALLELKDSLGFQHFNIPKVSLPRPSRHTIAFQILDTYPGTRFSDICITEISFSGEGDMH